MPSKAFEQPMTASAVTEFVEQIMSGQASPEQVKDFLTTLARRGETAEEIAAAVSVLRRHAVGLPLSQVGELCDTCGTGGDGQGTINVSTLAALVASAAGVRVSKHGNRAASSRCGSADVLEALGMNLAASPAQVARCIDDAGFGFCFAPAFHPSMKQVAPIRKELKIRTIFNLIGPLANPAPLVYQLVGVPESWLMRPMAEALLRLGIRRGMVVHGFDGLDEATTTTATEVLEVNNGAIADVELTPEAAGVPHASLEQLRGGDVQQNARLARAVLTGTETSAHRDLVALNAGCVLYVAGQVTTIRDGVDAAKDVLRLGTAARLLERVKALSHAAG